MEDKFRGMEESPDILENAADAFEGSSGKCSYDVAILH